MWCGYRCDGVCMLATERLQVSKKGIERVDIRNVTIDDLSKSRITIVADQIETEGFYARCVHSEPFHILPLELGIRRLFGLFSDGSDGRRAIDGLFGAGHIGQPFGESVSVLQHLLIKSCELALLLTASAPT